MIIPTVGRVVLYWPSGRSPTPGIDVQPCAAIVAHVHSNTCVNLAIFDDNGCPNPKPPTSIRLLQDGEERPAGGNYCEWMPYQKGQAAKAETLEKELAAKTAAA